MVKYRHVEDLISNENVIKVLNSARLQGGGDLLLDIVEKSKEKDVFVVYVTPKNYVSDDDLIFLATVTKKKGKEMGWYVNFKGTFKETF